MPRLLLPFVGLLAAACSCPHDKPTAPVDEPLPPPPPPAPAPVDRLRGLVTLDAEGPLFTPCGTDISMKVVGSAVDELLQALAQLEVSAGAPPVNVEIIGATRTLSGGAGMASIESLLVVLPPGSTTLCELDASYLYKARGNEPFWSLTVADGSLRFEAMALEAPIDIPATPLRAPGSSGPAWHGEQEGHSLELQLNPERCYDGMSGAAYPFQASVVLDGESFAGCAHQGWSSAD